MKRALVLGWGISGQGAARFLKRQGWQVDIADRRAPVLSTEEKIVEDTEELSLEGVSLFVLSSGIPWTHPLAQKAQREGIEVIGEAELAFRYLRQPTLGITGTNGKTTLTRLMCHLFQCSGRKARAVGNVGESLCGYLERVDPEEILVVELSSFQLETLKQACLDCALLLNITPDHLDRYASFAHYAKAKLSIESRLKEGGVLYVSASIVQSWRECFVYPERVQRFDEPTDRKLQGALHPQLLQAAHRLCLHWGVDLEKAQEGLASFQRPEHRLEWVAKIDGISYYNDSKATNVEAVVHALEALQQPVILIAGGLHKGACYDPWIETAQGKVKQVVAYGQAASLIEKDLGKALSVCCTQTFRDACDWAGKLAKQGDAVLLSPGCASFDQFQNYEERGRVFKQWVFSKGK